jgi:hypothetical protein
MKGINKINNQTNKFSNEIDLREIIDVFLDEKWLILCATSSILIIGIIYSLFLPNIYESKTLLVPANSSNTISGALRNYGGLAGLAGISLPSGAEESNSSKALEKLQTLSFFKNNILPNIYLPDLMAVESWDSKDNLLIYDKKIYDSSSSIWFKSSPKSDQEAPSPQKSFAIFKSNHIKINENQATGFITLSIKHKSPYIAKVWAELMVDQVNDFYKQKDKSESEKAVAYLNESISKISLSEIKQVIAELLQEETQKLTLIEAKEYYVFDYIDPPAIMEKKSEPKRFLISIASGIFGGILSILLVLIKNYIFRNKTS